MGPFTAWFYEDQQHQGLKLKLNSGVKIRFKTFRRIIFGLKSADVELVSVLGQL